MERSERGGAREALELRASEPTGSPIPPPLGHPLWRRGFRPFFLGAGAYAGLVVVAWLAIWHGALPAPGWLAPAWWHGHEMVFGLAAAAIAGFLLTATPVWTGRPALVGGPLAALFGLWLAGRVAIWAAGRLPAGLVALVDSAFLPALALVLARTLWRTGQRHNHALVGVVGALALANAAVHAQALGFASGSAPRALRFAVDGIVLLIVVIGGRITPAFTANALLRRGVRAAVPSRPRIARLAVISVALVAIADLLAPRSVATGVAASAAGVAVALRMAGWRTRETLGDPLLWSLHAGMAWVAIGLLLVGLADLGAPIPATAGLHALTAGAMGSMILAVMTRVGLGHTGRPLELPKGAAGSYGLVHAGALLRVAALAAPPALQAPLLLVGGLLWAAAFWLFAILYWPILCRPRPDGRDG